MQYTMRFTGRKSGALGITYPLTAMRDAPTESEAIDALYDEYEHISGVMVSVCGGPFTPASSVYATKA
jgi:hypothetical protein